MQIHAPSGLAGPRSRRRFSWEHGRHTTPRRHPAVDGDAPIRRELVERVRREIAEGTYDTPEKWALALERFLRCLED